MNPKDYDKPIQQVDGEDPGAWGIKKRGRAGEVGRFFPALLEPEMGWRSV